MAGPSPAKAKKRAAINLVALLEAERLDGDRGGQRMTRLSQQAGRRSSQIVFIFCS
jgi:hypothetical protein